MKPYMHVTKSIIDKTLRTESQTGVRLLEPLKSLALDAGMPMKILEEVAGSGDAEAHLHEADLWFCIEGAPMFTLGGTLVNSRERVAADGSFVVNEIMGDKIDGGDELVLSPGEWLYIQAGVPHKHTSKGTTRMVIIKIPKEADLTVL